MVENSQLVLKRADFTRASRSLFNPCLNKDSKTMLYLRYSFRGLEKVLLYDFSKDTLTVPQDCLNNN